MTPNEQTTEKAQRPRAGDLVDVTVRARVVWADRAGCCYLLERGGVEFNLGAVQSVTVIERPSESVGSPGTTSDGDGAV